MALLLTGAVWPHIGIRAEADNRALGGQESGAAAEEGTSALSLSPPSPTPCTRGRGTIPVPCRITLLLAELIYSQGAAGHWVLLAPPHLQEVQDVLGQLLIVVQHTLQCSRGSAPQNPIQTHHYVFLAPKNPP